MQSSVLTSLVGSERYLPSDGCVGVALRLLSPFLLFELPEVGTVGQALFLVQLHADVERLLELRVRFPLTESLLHPVLVCACQILPLRLVVCVRVCAHR